MAFFHKNESLIKNLFYWAGFLLILFGCGYLVFSNLSEIPIYDWDEARHGISAFEMSRDGNLISNTYLWENDYWNLKPPLSFWSIMLAYKIFGYNTFAFRFFSALSLCVITASSMEMMHRSFGRTSALITGALFARVCVQLNHLFWSGDPDALYCLFLFFALFSFFYAYTKSSNWWIAVGLFLSLAFLTKSFHVFSFMGGLGIAWLLLLFFTKKAYIKEIFSKALPAFLLPIFSWAVWRYTADGWNFLGQMFGVDVVNRIENEHTALEGFPYYIACFRGILEDPFCLIFFAITLFILFYTISHWDILEKKDVAFVLPAICTSLFVFFFFGFMQSIRSWYIWPMFMGLIPFVGWGISFIGRSQHAKNSSLQSILPRKIFVLVSCILLFIGMSQIPNLTKYQMNYDSGTRKPHVSIFYYTEDQFSFSEGEQFYYYVDISGENSEIPQSWALMGYYQDFIYTPGDIDSFLSDPRENVYLLVKSNSPSQLAELSEEYLTMKQIIKGDLYYLYSK